MLNSNKNKNNQFLDSEDEFYKLRNEFYKNNGVSEGEAGVDDVMDSEIGHREEDYEDRIFGMSEEDLDKTLALSSSPKAEGAVSKPIFDENVNDYGGYDEGEGFSDDIVDDQDEAFKEVYKDEEGVGEDNAVDDEDVVDDDLLDDDSQNEHLWLDESAEADMPRNNDSDRLKRLLNMDSQYESTDNHRIYDSEDDYSVGDHVDGLESDGISVSKSKLILARQLLENIAENTDKLLNLLSLFGVDEQVVSTKVGRISDFKVLEDEDESGKVIEGVFDGQNMIGPDGKQYSVPANYASKSKMVEGDILKLTITDRGTFVYKQIGPIDRVRKMGVLQKDESGQFVVMSEDKIWRVLPASVTYFKGEIGDEVVVLVPKSSDSKWAAVENIIKDAVR